MNFSGPGPAPSWGPLNFDGAWWWCCPTYGTARSAALLSRTAALRAGGVAVVAFLSSRASLEGVGAALLVLQGRTLCAGLVWASHEDRRRSRRGGLPGVASCVRPGFALGTRTLDEKSKLDGTAIVCLHNPARHAGRRSPAQPSRSLRSAATSDARVTPFCAPLKLASVLLGAT